MTHKLILLILMTAVGFFLFGCSLDADRPDNVLAPNGGGPMFLTSVGFDREALSGYSEQYLDQFDIVLEDIPDSAIVWGVGPLFPNERENLGYWFEIEEIEVQKYWPAGIECPIRFEVDNRILTEGITIRNVLLTYTYYEGAEPYGSIWTKFRLDYVAGYEDSVDVVAFGDNVEDLVSAFIYYDGWANWLPDSLHYLNGPLASEGFPARLESNLCAGTDTHLYWNSQINSWTMWFRALAFNSDSKYYAVITVENQYPYVLYFGVNVNDVELWHLEPVAPGWHIFTFGFYQDTGNVNQGENNVLVWTGGGS